MTPEEATALRKPFPASAIGQLPKAGVKLDYVGHAATTDRLLSVDPEWTWEPFALDEHGLPALDRRGNLWIRLTVCGVTRVGVGDGNSAKEVIGDAIRNAAMRFGVALDLWSKEELEQSREPAQRPTARRSPADRETAPEPEPEPEPTDGPPMITEGQLRALHAMLGDLDIKDRDAGLEVISNLAGRRVDSSKDLTKTEASMVLDLLKKDAER